MTRYRLARISGTREEPHGPASSDWRALEQQRDRLNDPRRGEWPRVRYGVRVAESIELARAA